MENPTRLTRPDDEATESILDGSLEGEINTNTTESNSLIASLRLIGDSMLRSELAELEMMKRREIGRLEAENRRCKLEDEMTRMMLQTQLQIASFVSQNRSNRKRKRSGLSDADGSDSSERDEAMILSLLTCNLI